MAYPLRLPSASSIAVGENELWVNLSTKIMRTNQGNLWFLFSKRLFANFSEMDARAAVKTSEN